jgi:hypothetical protein
MSFLSAKSVGVSLVLLSILSGCVVVEDGPRPYPPGPPGPRPYAVIATAASRLCPTSAWRVPKASGSWPMANVAGRARHRVPASQVDPGLVQAGVVRVALVDLAPAGVVVPDPVALAVPVSAPANMRRSAAVAGRSSRPSAMPAKRTIPASASSLRVPAKTQKIFGPIKSRAAFEPPFVV